MRSLFAALVLVLALTRSTASHAESFDPNTIVFIGSSTVEYWQTMEADFAPLKTLNLGAGGTTYKYLVEHAEEFAEKYPANRYVIYSGDNDIAWGHDPETVVSQFHEVADILHRKNPNLKILLISIKPNRALLRRLKIKKVREANELLAAEAKRLGYVTYVDIHSRMIDRLGAPKRKLFGIDGVHMTEAGYRLWADTLRPFLTK